MHHHHNCNYLYPKRYSDKGCWIEIFLEANFERDAEGCLLCDQQILYTASVELSNKRGVISGEPKESRDVAEFAAEELIDGWN